jgi:predicted porin
MTRRKIAALAAAGAFTVPGIALAQKSTVEIYGRANLGFDHYQAEGSSVAGADRPGRFRVFDNSSRVGFRGTEELGGGLRAIFQIETGVNIDNGSNTGQGGQAAASTGFWASRDSFVGLDSNFGRLTFGRQSIYWANGVNAQFSTNYINSQIPWTDGTQLGRISTGIAVARVSNVVQYTTPSFGGFNATVSYSPNAQEPVQNPGAGTDADGAIWGITVRATFGPFYGQVDWAQNNGNTTIGTGFEPEASFWKVGGSWGYLPGARLGLIWVRTESNNVAGTGPAGIDVDQDGWTINWEHTFGNVQVMAQYGQIGSMNGCTVATTTPGTGCADTKADAFMVGARYFFSKRTWVYASYNQLDNKTNQFADYTGSSITSTTGAPTPFGADPKIWALGLFHAF